MACTKIPYVHLYHSNVISLVQVQYDGNSQWSAIEYSTVQYDISRNTCAVQYCTQFEIALYCTSTSICTMDSVEYQVPVLYL
jgi:hypothetical protein